MQGQAEHPLGHVEGLRQRGTGEVAGRRQGRQAEHDDVVAHGGAMPTSAWHDTAGQLPVSSLGDRYRDGTRSLLLYASRPYFEVGGSRLEAVRTT